MRSDIQQRPDRTVLDRREQADRRRICLELPRKLGRQIYADWIRLVVCEKHLIKCPNGIAFDSEGRIYVVNYRDDKMLKIDGQGGVSPFATVSTKGLGHLCFKDDRFYVTASQSHAIYEVTLTGTVTRILGNGDRGIVDGTGADARLSFPNGIACHPSARRLYINEFINDS